MKVMTENHLPHYTSPKTLFMPLKQWAARGGGSVLRILFRWPNVEKIHNFCQENI
jgi:hypothetical protein